MSSYFATPYTIHFDDTMAYGGHHFMTAFKLQCAGRESLLFGRWVFDQPGVKGDLEGILLLTSEAYARNLSSARLGDRLVVLMTCEEVGRVSLRFCFRVLNADGTAVCCGYQTIVCADAKTGQAVPFPASVMRCFEELSEINEPLEERTFRQRMIAGGREVESLFDATARHTARVYLGAADPVTCLVPRALAAEPLLAGLAAASVSELGDASVTAASAAPPAVDPTERSAWCFSGQGSFDPTLLSARVRALVDLEGVFTHAAAIATEELGGDAQALFSGDEARCRAAAEQAPDLIQVGIFAQNVLGAWLSFAEGQQPAVLVGHSFGEIAAMCVADCFSFADGVRIVCARTRSLAQHAPRDGGLLAVVERREIVEELLARSGLTTLALAGRNHAQQTIVSGPRSELSVLREQLNALAISAVEVVTPAAFHHPSLRTASAAWYEQIEPLAFEKPNWPVYSPIGRRLLGASDDVASVLVAHLVRPFDLQGAVDDLQRSGITAFLDCGSSGALERLLRKAAGDSARVAVAPSERSDTPLQDEVAFATGKDREVAEPARSDETAALPREVCPRAPIAIVGRGCLLPGGARDPEALWQNLLAGVSGIEDQRDLDPHWSEDFFSAELTPDRSTSGLAGVVHDADLQCPDGLAPAQFAQYSRAQRLLAVAVGQCRPSIPQGKRVLCLIGSTADGYGDLDLAFSVAAAGLDPADSTLAQTLEIEGSSARSPHGAVARVFSDMLGAAAEVVLLDAACASSLYAVALGMRALETAQADVVLAGGLFCPGPGNSCLFSQFGGLTHSECRPFDAAASGVVFAEGAALVVLRRLEDAEAEGHEVVAVVRGAGLSSDGPSPSANVPRSPGQIIALSRCYENYDLDPATIQMVEAHGTATPVGDATELVTLSKFYGEHAAGPLELRSLKALLGHTGWAAGTASIIAVCEALQHQIHPQWNYEKPCAALEKVGSLLTVSTAPVAWPEAAVRRAAIDGFGFGGANAHVVLEAYRPSVLGRGGSARSTSYEDPLELAVVAAEALIPSQEGSPVRVSARDEQLMAAPSGASFRRDQVRLPDDIVLLPDIVDDMDVSQTMTIAIAAQAVRALPELDPSMKRDTALILAMEGKTERSVEATLRVLTTHLGRRLPDTDAAQCIAAAAAQIRPSGPYTLQCMMPNVAAGRAAARLNLQGPNFVVDAARDSLDAALRSSALLLGDDIRMAVVAGLNASRHVPHENSAELAAAFVVMTPGQAAALGLPVLCRLRPAAAGQQAPDWQADRDPLDRRGAAGAEELLRAVHAARKGKTSTVDLGGGRCWTVTSSAIASETSAQTDAEYAQTHADVMAYEPIWVEEALAAPVSEGQLPDTLFVLPASAPLVREVAAAAALLCPRFHLLVAGALDTEDARVTALDPSDEDAVRAALARLAGGYRAIVAIERPDSWDPLRAIQAVATQREALDLLFLVAREHSEALRAGAVELWSLCLGGVDAQGTPHPKSGGYAGFLKAVAREMPGTRARPLVLSVTAASAALSLLLRERAAAHDDPEEVLYLDTERLVRRLHAEYGPAEPLPIDARSVVIATGGARGVTAVLLEALVRETGCTVVAFGRSTPEPNPYGADPLEAERLFYERAVRDNPGVSMATLRKQFTLEQARWEVHETIEGLRSQGGRVDYLASDLARPEDVERAVAYVFERYGRVDAILHGAGVQFSKRLDLRSLAEFRLTLDVKLLGLHHLLAACHARTGSLVPVHALTSAYSVYGNDGQHDYGAANETLDRICQLGGRASGSRWTSVGWLAWNQIGMTRGSEYKALAKERNLSGVGREQGQQLFLDVLYGRGPECIHVQLSDAERTRYAVKTTRAAATRVARQVPLDLSDLGCLVHHQVRGKPTLPGAWALERMVRASRHGDEHAGSVAVLEDIRFDRFVRFGDGQTPVVRTIIEPEAESDRYRVRLVGDVVHKSGLTLASDVNFCEARLRLTPSFPDERPSLSGAGSTHAAQDPYVRADPSTVQLSGPFDCLADIQIGAQGRRAFFAPNVEPDDDALKGSIPALLLDAAWRLSAMHFEAADEGGLHVPVSADRITVACGAQEGFGGEALEIRTAAPVRDGANLRNPCIEALDRTGQVRLRVEGAVARRVS